MNPKNKNMLFSAEFIDDSADDLAKSERSYEVTFVYEDGSCTVQDISTGLAIYLNQEQTEVLKKNKLKIYRSELPKNENENTLVCPYCGYEYEIERSLELINEEMTDCQRCESVFFIKIELLCTTEIANI